MFFQEIDKQFDTLLKSLTSFVPELLVCAAIVVMLLLRLLPRLRMHMGIVVLLFGGFGLALALIQWLPLREFNLVGDIDANPNPQDMPFTGLIVVDHFTVAMRMLLLAFALLVTWLCVLSGIPD